MELRDLEKEKKQRFQRKILAACLVLSIALLSFPVMQKRFTRWKALAVGRRMAVFLYQVRSRAVLEQTAYEVRLSPPEKIEIYHGESCEQMAEAGRKVEERSLSDFGQDFEIASSDWVKEFVQIDEVSPIYHVCYDSLRGASIGLGAPAGTVETGMGFIPVIHRGDREKNNAEHLVALTVEAPDVKIRIE